MMDGKGLSLKKLKVLLFCTFVFSLFAVKAVTAADQNATCADVNNTNDAICDEIETGAEINLNTEAKVYCSNMTKTPDGKYDIDKAYDGDVNTWYIGSDRNLREYPGNIIIEFDEPTAIQRVVILSQVWNNVLSWKDFEIYAWAENSWAGEMPLTVVKDTNEVKHVIDFAPVKTKYLRIRIRDSWYGNRHPRIREMQVFRALPGAKIRPLKDAPIPDEKRTEQYALAQVLGKEKAEIIAGYIEYPGEGFDKEKGYLYYTKSFMDTMLEKGTDQYGKINTPMFVSMLDISTQKIPNPIPEPLFGQRPCDRCPHGTNLFHDIMLLLAMDETTKITKEDKYRQGSTDYLTFFVKNCPVAKTGLFPWGEHAHWNIYTDKAQVALHEYLGGIPGIFWERLWKIEPNAVRGEADGLINHIHNLETFDFDRHANIFRPLPVPRTEEQKKTFLAYPRHAGFYINLWTFVYAKTGDTHYKDLALRMIDYYWEKRDPNSGLPYGFPGKVPPAAVLAMAVSMLEGAEFLPDGDLKELYRQKAKAYIDSVVRLPHKPEEGKFFGDFPYGQSCEGAVCTEYESAWEYGYGGGFSPDDAVLLSAAYRYSGDKRALELAEGFAGFYATHNPPSPVRTIRARAYASIIGLLLDVYDLTKKPEYLEQAERYAQYAISNLYYNGLFKCATNTGHYESEMLVSDLVYNIVWLHALKYRPDIKVQPNYFNR